MMHLRRIRSRGRWPGRAWWVWGTAAGFYFLAMFHRMSLGVASLQAGERLGISIDTIALLSAVQLGLYLLLVIPAGLAADRIGPRRTLAGGLAVMAAGEIAFGLAQTAPLALGGRALVGIGDAFIFLSVLRLAQNWFPAGRYAMLALLTATAGALGQLGTTIPLGTALDTLGWTPVFVGSGIVTALALVVCLTFVRDHPPGTRPRAAGGTPGIGMGRTIRLAWATPGTRHGFWTHFTLMGPFVAVTALWGYPYLVEGRGMAEGTARAWLLACVLVCAVSSPALGMLVTRAPATRAPATIGIGALLAGLWSMVMLWPTGPAPLALTVGTLVLTGAACAAAMLAFDFAREDNPPERVGTATGVVNIGGFLAAVMLQLLVGQLLRLGGGDDYALALMPLPALMIVGCAQMVRYARRTARTQPAPTMPALAGESSP